VKVWTVDEPAVVAARHVTEAVAMGLKASHVTVKDAAAVLEVSVPTMESRLSPWASSWLRINELAALADVLGVDVSALLSFADA